MKNHIQYLAIIAPNSRVTSDAIDMKIRCKNEYGWNYTNPHFTVFNIIQPIHNEERLIRNFERNIKNISPFQIDLCGFDYFSASTYTLYIKLKEEKRFSEMAQYIRKFSNPIMKSVKDNPPHYNFRNPHLTIAKGILEPEFLQVWKSWENEEYQSSTIADQIILLRRPFTNGNLKYETVGEYPLLGKGLLDIQVHLF
jgi:2'-5' RNA ligase